MGRQRLRGPFASLIVKFRFSSRRTRFWSYFTGGPGATLVGVRSCCCLGSFRRHAAGALDGALRFALRGFRCRAKRVGRGWDSPFHQVTFEGDHVARRHSFRFDCCHHSSLRHCVLGAAFTVSNRFGTHYWVEWRNLGISNGVTAVVLVPALLLLANRLSGTAGKATPARVIEGSVLGLGIVVVGTYVFATVPAGPGTSPALLYAPIPLLIWAALRFGLNGISATMLVVTFQAIWGAMYGRGPITTPEPPGKCARLTDVSHRHGHSAHVPKCAAGGRQAVTESAARS